MTKRSILLTGSLVVTAILASCASGEEAGTAPPAPAPAAESEPVGASTQALGRNECASGTDSLKTLARKCQAAMKGVAIQAFDCKNLVDDPLTGAVGGAELPGQGTPLGPLGGVPSATCNAPNVLNGACDPGSKFHMLHRGGPDYANDGIYIAAHCRRKGLPEGHFGDIAIIAYNSDTGDTCFFQSDLTDIDLTGNKLVSPPSSGSSLDGTGTFPWKSPAQTADDRCVTCHDNGPFIRSPYLAQLGEVWPSSSPTHHPHYLPGTLSGDVSSWNQDGSMPYRFVGLDFQGWEAYSVKTDQYYTPPGASAPAPSTCTGCHRMGLSQILDLSSPGSLPTRFTNSGTTHDFAFKATNPLTALNHQESKTPFGPWSATSSPIWMTPGENVPTTANQASVAAIVDCADRFSNSAALKPVVGSDCHVDRFARGNTCGPEVEIIVNGKTQSQTSGYTDDSEMVLGCKDQPGCQPGVYFWTSLHGPFYQNSPSSVGLKDPLFKGSYERITVVNGSWVLQRRLDATDLLTQSPVPPSPGAPGGALGSINYSRIASIIAPDQCTIYSNSIGLLSTSSGSPSPVLLSSPASTNLSILSGFIGNVARNNSFVAGSDLLRVRDTSSPSNTSLIQQHMPTAPGNHWFTAETWSTSCANPPGSAWTAAGHFAAQDQISESDVVIASGSNTSNMICYLTGIGGNWASTRPDPAFPGDPTKRVQPYATIYRDIGNGDWRLKVFPPRFDPAGDGVFAYASCLNLN